MLKKPPKLSLLDKFVLLLIRDRINTLYLLEKEAGLSIGATSPSLKRLERLGLVVADETGKRGMRKFHVSTIGRGVFQGDWLGSLEPAASDIESITRPVAMAKTQNDVSLAKHVLGEGSLTASDDPPRSCPWAPSRMWPQLTVRCLTFVKLPD
jgi:hypothetical protein